MTHADAFLGYLPDSFSSLSCNFYWKPKKSVEALDIFFLRKLVSSETQAARGQAALVSGPVRGGPAQSHLYCEGVASAVLARSLRSLPGTRHLGSLQC